MIKTTAGNKTGRSINEASLKQHILGLILLNDNPDVLSILKTLLNNIDEMPTTDTIDGKAVQKAYYPRIMVKDNDVKDEKAFRIGDNTHHCLNVITEDNHSHLAFFNSQCCEGTEYGTYSFVGTDYGDGEENVEFDEVWIEVK